MKIVIYRDVDDGTYMFDRDVRDMWNSVVPHALVTDNASSARLAQGDRGWHGLVVGPVHYAAEAVLAGKAGGSVVVREFDTGAE